MSLPTTQRELRQARKLSRVLGTVVFLLGIAAMVIYFLWPAGGARSIAVEIAYLAANVFFSASLVAVILAKVTFEEANLSAQAAIQSSVEAVLSPIREALLPDCQSDYRWHCILSMPEPEDDLPAYAVQVVSIEKNVPEVPTELRFVCVASYADDALNPYADDPRYQLRWVVDEELDPFQAHVFDVISVKVEGRTLTGKAVSARAGTPRSKILSYRVPRELRALARCRIEFTVLLRKHVGNDTRILIRTQLFATTFRADFRCIVSRNLRLTGSWISSSEVTALGSHPHPYDTVVARPGLPADLHIRYDMPLQAGSTVGFHLSRESRSSVTDVTENQSATIIQNELPHTSDRHAATPQSDSSDDPPSKTI